MVKVTFSEGFEKSFKKLKDKTLKEKIIKQINKIIENPSVGKPLKHDLKGERTLYIKPHRLIYAFKDDEIILLRFLHRKEVYK
ncbi:MAG: type II toxin-antitoxin system RelE/ParE family toxin [Nanoarchaeota archaeon]|nr:type II toxin-antitoxin system RelE/ParE family toxin [Nanoarchaeota archaeon]